MCSLVDFKIFGSREYLSTARKWTRKRFFTSVNPDMIHKFVLGFKGSPVSGTILPETSVICTLRPTHMLNLNH